MTKLYLVRHARPAAGWGEDPDPGLDPAGEAQAQAAAATLAAALVPLPILTSPLRRCRETALPLAQRWGAAARVFPPVAELPAPPLDLPSRQRWLHDAMHGTWQALNDGAPPGAPDYLDWRRMLLDALASVAQESVVCSHFIAINAVVGAALGRDDVVVFRPDHASITCVDVTQGRIRVVDLGRQSDTTVLARR